MSLQSVEGISAYIDFVALKRHFEGGQYDYTKYRGKVNVSTDTFANRPDRHLFAKVSRKVDSHGFLLANVVAKPEIWSRELNDRTADATYMSWKKRTSALTYTIEQELGTDLSLGTWLTSSAGKKPKILSDLLMKKVSMETFSVVGSLTKSFPHWLEDMRDDPIACRKIKVAQRYFPLLEIDKEKVVLAIKQLV